MEVLRLAGIQHHGNQLIYTDYFHHIDLNAYAFCIFYCWYGREDCAAWRDASFHSQYHCFTFTWPVVSIQVVSTLTLAESLSTKPPSHSLIHSLGYEMLFLRSCGKSNRTEQHTPQTHYFCCWSVALYLFSLYTRVETAVNSEVALLLLMWALDIRHTAAPPAQDKRRAASPICHYR